VADLYAAVRRSGADANSWAAWREGRDALMANHSQTPVAQDARAAFTGMPFFAYDPSWRLVGRVEPATGEGALAPDGTFTPIGDVVAERDGNEIRLTLLWLEGYGGGLFLPFRDATCGAETYGGGRYLLDQVKGADLGVAADGDLVLDFNFAYHPSCAHDPRWTCPLAPAGNVISQPVHAGEMLPGEGRAQS
jgi:uncharacterized protein (DUF1684 family)